MFSEAARLSIEHRSSIAGGVARKLKDQNHQPIIRDAFLFDAGECLSFLLQGRYIAVISVVNLY